MMKKYFLVSLYVLIVCSTLIEGKRTKPPKKNKKGRTPQPTQPQQQTTLPPQWTTTFVPQATTTVQSPTVSQQPTTIGPNGTPPPVVNPSNGNPFPGGYTAGPPVLGGSGQSGTCDALKCDFEANTLCKLSNGLGGTNGFAPRTGKTGNWAAGVPVTDGSKTYAAAELPKKSSAVLQSQTFNADQPSKLKFKYYEEAMSVSLKGCIDSEVTCPFATSRNVQNRDRQWRDGSIDIPAGLHTIYFLANNTGQQYAAVGLDELNLDSYGGVPSPCP